MPNKTEQLTANITIDASPDAVFALLGDPAKHSAIDGTGWVRDPVDTAPLTHTGQVFRMAMYHENHPDKNYETANTVETLEPAKAIAWKLGADDAKAGGIGGWMWRYDLEPTGTSQSKVTLTYDWSEASAAARELIQFPPFGAEYLQQSLQHLSGLAAN